MRVELHILQSFAPSCLNRDDVNAPKECEFGGVRRARISSQCLKRAVRTYWTQEEMLADNRGIRTRRLVEEVSRRLGALGRDPEESQQVARTLLGHAGLGVKNDGATEYLLFISGRAIDDLAKAIHHHWDAMLHLQRDGDSEVKDSEPSLKGKKKSKVKLPDAAQQAVNALLAAHKSADIAMFGRMIADLPSQNVDAACQVAHAISTHRANVDLDFFTAVDDLQPGGEPGAGMMDTIEFNSACFYRYSLVDMKQLESNLGGDTELALEALKAFIRASVEAIPSGRQNSTAAHNPPSFVMAVVRKTGTPWSLANAFENPVSPGEGSGVVGSSIRRLDEYWGKLARAYGLDGVDACMVLSPEDVELRHVGQQVDSLDALISTLATKVEVGRQ